MSDRSTIEWTDATWNPVSGCSHVSDGCRFCYAEALSLRFKRSAGPWTAANAGQNVVLHPEKLDDPYHWRRPRRIFVNSMSDLFHERVPDEFIWSVFSTMWNCNWHTFQVLTKRPERLVELLATDVLGDFNATNFPHVWIGVSVENQRAADERIPLLLQVPAKIRFLSCEPLLGPVDLTKTTLPSGGTCHPLKVQEGHYPRSGDVGPINWIIAGGESGPHARPMDLDWARSLRDQCNDANVAFFFKQVGGRTPKARGRVLDGRTWDEFPTGAPKRELAEVHA